MGTYERNGVQVDQCEECRGMFLDSGELEHVIEAANTFDRVEHSGDEDREHYHDHDDRSHRRRRTNPASIISEFLGGGE